SGPLDQPGLLAHHPLAVVLEVGLEPPRRVEQLFALAGQRVEIGDQLFGFRGRGVRRFLRTRYGLFLLTHDAYDFRLRALLVVVADLSVRALVVGRRRSRTTVTRRRLLRLHVLVQPPRELVARAEQRLVRGLHRVDVGSGERVLQALQAVLDLLTV